MPGPRYTPLVDGLPATVPFVGPETQERALGRPFRARLGANESVFGPAPAAIEAMRRAAAEVWKYGDPESHDLRAAIARDLGIGPEAVICGAGIDGLLGTLVRLTVAAGDPVVTSAGAYPTFNFHVAAQGGMLHTVPYRDDREDPEALLARASETGARLVYLANPDNPMGSWHDAATIQATIDAVPDGTLLVLDEAYVEFAPQGTAPAIDPTERRVIRLRTFSKAHGMAGARIGYGIGHPDLIRAFDKVRDHFGISRISQAGALAALGERWWLDEVRGRVAAAKARIGAIAREAGLLALPSATNFVTIDCRRDGVFARAVVDALAARGVFVRMPFVAPGNRCIRVTCGTEAELDVFAAAFPEALADAGGR